MRNVAFYYMFLLYPSIVRDCIADKKKKSFETPLPCILVVSDLVGEDTNQRRKIRSCQQQVLKALDS